MTGEIGGAGPSTRDLARLVDAAKDGSVLRVHVQPGAKGEGIAGVHGNALKVRVRAPATSGRANEAVLALLAKELGLPAVALTLSAGAFSRDKSVRFAGLSAAELETRLAGTFVIAKRSAAAITEPSAVPRTATAPTTPDVRSSAPAADNPGQAVFRPGS
jgi:uncharacterized protein